MPATPMPATPLRTDTHPPRRCELPAGALLRRLAANGRQAAYTDCYVIELDARASQAQYVEAFYTTPLFKLERWLLARAGRPSSDADARRLAQGESDRFAAWRVAERAPDQLLLHDDTGRTGSWLMSEPGPAGGTRLYFGSGVFSRRGSSADEPRLGLLFWLLLPLHKAYSRALLQGARSRLRALASGATAR
jgi:hypothetical protein